MVALVDHILEGRTAPSVDNPKVQDRGLTATCDVYINDIRRSVLDHDSRDEGRSANEEHQPDKDRRHKQRGHAEQRHAPTAGRYGRRIYENRTHRFERTVPLT
jgi:hypothetical protein